MKKILILLLLLFVVGYIGKYIITSQEADSGNSEESARQVAVVTEVVEEMVIAKAEESIEEISLSSVETAKSLFEDVLFDYDSYTMREDAKPILEGVASFLNKNKKKNIIIEGYCDERGTSEYNLALAEKRARATKNYIISLGIPPSRMLITAYGEEKPLCTQQNETCWQRNRRTHFVVTEQELEKPAEAAEAIIPVPPAEEVIEEVEVLPVEEEVAKPAEAAEAIIPVPLAEEVIEEVEVLPVEEEVEKPAEAAEAIIPVPPAEEVIEEVEVLPVEEEVEKPAEAAEAIIPVPPAEEVIEEAEVLPVEEEVEKPAEAAEAIIPVPPAEEVVEEAEVLPVEEEVAKAEEVAEAIIPVPPAEEVIEEAEVLPVGEGVEKIALLPFENLTDNGDALKQVTPALIVHTEKKGFTIVDQVSTDNFLCKQRVRSTGYISKELAGKIKEELGVKAILAGSLVSFSNANNPKFGLMARLIDSSSGVILWADYAFATGDDFTTILGLGRLRTISGLIPRVMDKLFSTLSIDAIQRQHEHAQRIAVMPFQNNSEFRNAGMITMYMFLTELLKEREFEPIEYGNIRKQIVDLKVRNKEGLDYKKMSALSETLSAKGILVGVVDSYSSGADISSPPRVAISARLLEGRGNKILWYNSHQLTGDEDIVALDWGRIRSVHKVAYNVVAALVEKMKRSIPITSGINK